MTNNAREFTGDSLEWKDVSFRIGDKQILSKMSGTLERGELTAVLGPSGSGKTTLMNILAGRMATKGSGRSLEGSVSVGGHLVDPVKFRSHVAYVMQEDALVATATPQEALEFSANLRLPKEDVKAKTQRDAVVQRVLESLKLGKCKDTIIGNNLLKGVSGGERKRTSVGLELIVNPSLLFLDEPLSGLDSYAAYTTVQVLRDQIAADLNTPVLCTVHQPSSEIFFQFHKVMVIGPNGRIVYHGPTSEISAFFRDNHNADCPANYNPADYVLFLLQTAGQDKLDYMADFWDKHCETEVVPLINARRSAALQTSPVLGMERAKPRTSFRYQVTSLLKRECNAVVRNPGALAIRYGINAFMSLIFGVVFWQVGSDKGEIYYDLHPSEFKSYFGALVALAISSMMGNAQTVILNFPMERGIFLREYALNMYSSIAYFFAKMVVEVPLSLVHSLIQVVISYWMMGLKGDFILFVLSLWFIAVVTASMALILSCGAATPEKAIQMMPAIFVPQILFTGLFIAVSLIPVWLRWIQYLCFLKYGLNLLFITEFGEGFHSEADANNIEYGNMGFYVGIMFAIMVVCRVGAIAILRSKAKFVY